MKQREQADERGADQLGQQVLGAEAGDLGQSTGAGSSGLFREQLDHVTPFDRR